MKLFENIFGQKERPVSDVPKYVSLILVISLSMQLFWHASRPLVVSEANKLPAPPDNALLEISSIGEPAVLAKVLMLWLQASDYQLGTSVSFRELDYSTVIAWLEKIMELDERSQYPLLSASRVYSEVSDKTKKRLMLDFVYNKFLEAPNQRWQWMAHAVYVAKHRLKDIELAYRFASALRLHATAEDIPAWAKQMEIFILEQQGEIEEAKILIGALLESGVISDINEMKFLEERLALSANAEE